MHIARIALIAALAFGPAAFAEETPSAMLEKGIFQEETAGNLDAAVKVYKQIVDEANAARHAVAEAQYRLGVCYQKQGKKDEAQAAFRDLIAEYADEKDLVAKAQKELGEAAPAPIAAKYEPLELNPAPWPDGELMVLSVETKTGMDLGRMFYTARRLDSHSEPVTLALPPTALSDTNRKGGEWRIERPRMSWPILDAVRDAAAEVGIAKVDDFNRGDNEGSDYFDVNQRRGRRWSAARGFLKPILNRPNLRVVTGAHVERLIFDGRRAIGVHYAVDGVGREARAGGEILLAAGAIGTPQLLELSGVGRPEIVASLGRDLVHASPGIGENLQDHLQLRTIFRIAGARTLNVEYRSLIRRAGMALDYALRRRGPMTMAPSQVGAFAKSSPDFATANLEFHVQPLSLDRFGEPLHAFPAITLSVCNLRPTSRGSSHAVGPDPLAAPEIRPNYLSTDEDARVAADSIRLARRIAAAPALAPFRPEEYLPGAAAQSDAELRRAAGDIGTTIFHPVGTAKMGRVDDPAAVVDASLKLRGVGGIRIADASVMPRITSGNTNSPTMMIAEKAAAMILADAGGR